MDYEEFQHLARLSVVGSLDADERERFCLGLRLFGPKAEAFLDECRALNTLFALSLAPREPAAGTKEKLLAKIRACPLMGKTPPRPTQGLLGRTLAGLRSRN